MRKDTAQHDAHPYDGIHPGSRLQLVRARCVKAEGEVDHYEMTFECVVCGKEIHAKVELARDGWRGGSE